jgi:hypothetical protein
MSQMSPNVFYEILSANPYMSWVSAYKYGALTHGQVKYRVQSWIRNLGPKCSCPNANYKEWLVWMHFHHDGSFEHILR